MKISAKATGSMYELELKTFKHLKKLKETKDFIPVKIKGRLYEVKTNEYIDNAVYYNLNEIGISLRRSPFIYTTGRKSRNKKDIRMMAEIFTEAVKEVTKEMSK